MKRSALQKISNKYKDEFESVSRKLQDLNTKKTSNETQQQVLKEELIILNKHLKELRTLLKTQIVQSEFDNEEEILKALLDHKTEKNLTGIKKDLDNKTVELGTLEKKLNSELEILTKEKDFDISAEEAAKKENEIKSLRDNLFKRVGEIRQRFSMDDQIILRNKSVFDEISLQEKEVKKWKDLMDLLGGSKHAFNTYVQRLTLQSLIGYANLHLYKLNKRYSLKMNEAYKTGEELNFNLIDHYQTDKARYVDTSSGGEKFIISLALALGLSDLASSNVRIDSLFIDEGFGTLDNNTLETVISTLETLKSQGKMIGIISHVENLKERIPSQIQIHKKSSGVSEVVIV
jgi:exonuclease SbcC